MHLSSCSPCYQEFAELRKEAASQRRRTQAWIAVAAVLIFAVAGWLWVRIHHSVPPPVTAVLDLREISVARGQNPSETNQHPLEISRSAKHLILELPIGSKEGSYDVALLSESGSQIQSASGTAQLQNHVVTLRADIDVSSVRPGLYLLAHPATRSGMDPISRASVVNHPAILICCRLRFGSKRSFGRAAGNRNTTRI